MGMRSTGTPKHAAAERVELESSELAASSPPSAHARLMTWVWTLVIALFGGLLRFVRLGQPRAVVFDETYYVKDAWTMLNTGEPMSWPDEVSLGGQMVPVDTA